jgi:hypothetical protein
MLGLDVMGVPMLLHCTSGGVRFTPRTRWMASNRLVAEYRFLVDVDEGVRHAFEHLGEKYDYVSLFGFLPVLLFRWLKIKVGNPLASARAMVCSEFILHVDQGDRIPEWDALEYETTTPQELLDICEQRKSFECLFGGVA